MEEAGNGNKSGENISKHDNVAGIFEALRLLNTSVMKVLASLRE